MGLCRSLVWLHCLDCYVIYLGRSQQSLLIQILTLWRIYERNSYVAAQHSRNDKIYTALVCLAVLSRVPVPLHRARPRLGTLASYVWDSHLEGGWKPI